MENKTKPFISVVTPVYNGERYLAECIESVLAQTRTDWEYIIVDNRSRDQSAAIAERYAAADVRIRVIRCDEFVNVHRNFSRGARLIDAHSRYCKFVAADDWIYPQCLEHMVAVAERHPTVGIVSSYKLIDDRVGNDGFLPYNEEFLPGTEVVRRALLDGTNITGSPTQLLFRADAVRREQAFLDETVWHSDTDAALRLFLEYDLGFVHQVLTFTRMHPGALTSSFSHRLNTYTPNDVRMIVRYGPRVLSAAEYQKAIRRVLGQYAWFLAKQKLKASRRRDAEFQAFHREEIGRMLAELNGDAQTRATLKWIRALLLKRASRISSSLPAGAPQRTPPD